MQLTEKTGELNCREESYAALSAELEGVKEDLNGVTLKLTQAKDREVSVCQPTMF